MRIACAAVHLCPVLAYLFGILQNTRMLQNAGRLCAVFEEGTTVSLHSHCCAERIFHHGNRAESHQTVESKPRNVQDLIPLKNDILVMLSRLFIGVCMIGVEKITRFRIAVDLDVFRQQRIKTNNLILSVTHNLCVGVAP